MLPKINEFSYTQIDLPSGKKIGVKPWTVKEEKSLLFAVEGINNHVDGQKEVVKFIEKCVDNPSLFKTCSNTDCISILLTLRKLSKGCKIEFSYNCTGELDGGKLCGFELHSELDLNTNVNVKNFDSSPIVVREDLTLTIKEVSFSVFESMIAKYNTASEFNYNFILESIDAISYKGEVFESFTREELVDFIDQFSSNEYDLVLTTLEQRSAEIVLSKDVKCGRCGHMNHVAFGDLYNFLAF